MQCVYHRLWCNRLQLEAKPPMSLYFAQGLGQNVEVEDFILCLLLVLNGPQGLCGLVFRCDAFYL